MIQGLRTVVYNAEDLAAAKAWYTEVVGHGPSFDEPFYVGFEVGGFELGLTPEKAATAGVETYWGTPDVAAEVERLLGLGATMHCAVKDVGEGIKVALVRDPFGNILGVIENPTFDLGKVR